MTATLDPTRFEDFVQLTKQREDISRFRDSFFHMLDLNGAVPSYSIGFHFSLSDKDDASGAETAQAMDVFKTFSPAVLYVGNQGLQQRLQTMGKQSILMPWFEGGGFALVLKAPANADADAVLKPRRT